MSVWYHTKITRQETVYDKNANEKVVIDMNLSNKAFRKKLQSQYAPLLHHDTVNTNNTPFLTTCSYNTSTISPLDSISDLRSEFMQKYDFQSKLIAPSLSIRK